MELEKRRPNGGSSNRRRKREGVARLVRELRAILTRSDGVSGSERVGQRLDFVGNPSSIGGMVGMMRIDSEQCKKKGFSGGDERLRRKFLKMLRKLLLKELLL